MAKNIFENFDYDEYYELLNTALFDKVYLVHNNEGMGGFSFIWKRESPFKSGKMVRVAVSYCSPKDQFCRKIGALNALNNFYNKEETILLPVGSEDSAEIVAKLRYLLGIVNHF